MGGGFFLIVFLQNPKSSLPQNNRMKNLLFPLNFHFIPHFHNMCTQEAECQEHGSFMKAGSLDPFSHSTYYSCTSPVPIMCTSHSSYWHTLENSSTTNYYCTTNWLFSSPSLTGSLSLSAELTASASAGWGNQFRSYNSPSWLS